MYSICIIKGIITASSDEVLMASTQISYDHVLLQEYFNVLCNVPFLINIFKLN